MLNKLDIPAKGSVQDFSRVKGQMYDVLVALSNSDGGIGVFSEDDLSGLVSDLIEKQRRDLKAPLDCSWCIPEKIDHMPSEARVDFIFEPTYIAVAILTFVKVHFPDVSVSVEGFDDCLKKGMEFSTLRQLSGHGYASFEGTLNAIRILDLGGVPEFIRQNKMFNDDLYLLLQQIDQQIVSDLRKGNTLGFWNSDVSMGMEEIAEILKCFE